tara:strand:+ start:35816 stop:37426 length:1611 start_codon:yes stop_codon:yes gene_type:complete
MQATLNMGGDLRIVTPGIYEFDVSNGPMTFPSNTTLYIGAGVTLRVANGSPSALFTNSYARSTGVTMAGANVSYTVAAGSGWATTYVVEVTNMTAAQAALFPVNSWVSAVVLGHGLAGAAGTALAGRGYRGVNRVVSQTINGASSSIQYLMQQNVYPGSAPSTNPVTLYQANENIAIWGPGTIDGNGANARQTFIDGFTPGSGNPQSVVLWWRHAYNVVVTGPYFLRGITWTIGSNYVRNYTVRQCTCELRASPTFDSMDFIHLSGNHQTVLVEDIDGGSGDNAVGMTIDCTDAAAQPGNGFNFAYQSPGDMYDVTIRRISAEAICEDGSFGIVAMYGPEAYLYRNISINGVTGQGSSGVQLANYAATNQTKLTVDRLVISNVRTFSGSAQVELTAGAVFDIGELSIDSLITPREDVPAYRAYDTATGTIRSLLLRSLVHAPYDNVTYTRTAPLARFGGVNINALNCANSENIVQAINVRAFAADGPGNILKVGIQNSSGTSSGTGAGLAALWADTGAGTAAAPVYTNSSSNGTAL